jgi:hypothetical protein
MWKVYWFALVALLIPLAAFAPGTVPLESIATLLRQRPELSTPLLSAFELSDTVIGVRLGPHFKHLSGGRIGPYSVAARARGSKGSYEIEVVVCTETQFVNAKGKTIEPQEATHFKEVLQGFIVRPPGGRVNCPSNP